MKSCSVPFSCDCDKTCPKSEVQGVMSPFGATINHIQGVGSIIPFPINPNSEKKLAGSLCSRSSCFKLKGGRWQMCHHLKAVPRIFCVVDPWSPLNERSPQQQVMMMTHVFCFVRNFTSGPSFRFKHRIDIGGTVCGSPSAELFHLFPH